MKRSFRLLLPLVALVLAAAIGDASAQQKPYSPGLGDLMTATVQPRHTKLGLAAREGNWPYAAYEQLTAACNTCHRSADRGVIVIQPPASASFPDQDFRPVKQ